MSCSCRACVSAARNVRYAATGPLRVSITSPIRRSSAANHSDHSGVSRTFSGLLELAWVRVRILIAHAQFSEGPNLPNGQLVFLAQ
jgi:hypothetical protein